MIHRHVCRLTAVVAVSALISGACGTLRTARIRKDVTVTTYRRPEFAMRRGSVIAVVPLAPERESLSSVSLSSHEAAADMFALKFWERGFVVIDRVFIKEAFDREGTKLAGFSLARAVEVGGMFEADYVLLVSLADLEEHSQSLEFGPFNVVNTVDTSALVGVNCRLIDVASRQVVWSGAATTQDKNLQLCLRRIVLRLLQTLGPATEYREREIPGLGVHF